MQEKDDVVLAEFRRRRTRQLVAFGCAMPLLLSPLLDRWGLFPGNPPPTALASLAAAGVLAIAAAFVLNWRCPVCDRTLGRTLNPPFCPRCGILLQ